MAYDSMQQIFLDEIERNLKKNDIYSMLDDQDLFDLIVKMLQENPQDRISPQDILKHNFIQKELQRVAQ